MGSLVSLTIFLCETRSFLLKEIERDREERNRETKRNVKGKKEDYMLKKNTVFSKKVKTEERKRKTYSTENMCFEEKQACLLDNAFKIIVLFYSRFVLGCCTQRSGQWLIPSVQG